MTRYTPPMTPAEREALGHSTVSIEYGGNTYTMPASFDELDGSVLEQLEDGKAYKTMKQLLGREQWKTFQATKPKVKHFTELFELWAEKAGLDLGE